MGDTLKVVEQPEAMEHGPQFYMRVQERTPPSGISRTTFEYEIHFSEHWQPDDAGFTFLVPGNVYTSFSISSAQREVSGGKPNPSFKRLESRLSIWTDEVSVLEGAISESGEVSSANGDLRFGIENNDAECKRESGNVRYSAVLGVLLDRQWHRTNHAVLALLVFTMGANWPSLLKH